MGQVADLYATLGLRPDKEAWAKGNELVGGVKKALGWFAGFEAVKGLIEIGKSTIELGGHLDDMRQKTGLSAETIQKWGYVAKLGGSDADGFAHGVGHLARTFKEASDGSDTATKALHDVGLTSASIAEALKSGDGLDAALLKISDKFAAMPDGAQKTALAMAVFGKSGAELIPTLNQGAEGLAKLRKEAEESGAIISNEAVSALDELGDNIDKVKMSLTGLKNQAVVALLPMLKEMVDAFMAWVKVNRQLIIETITTAVHGLVSALGVLATVGSVVADIIGFLSEHATLARAILVGLGVVITAVAVEAAAAWIIGFWPVVAVVALIAGLVLLFDQLLEAFLDGKGVFAAVGRAIRDVFMSVVSGIKDAFYAVGDFFTSIARTIKNAFWAVINWVTEKIDWVWTQLGKAKDAVAGLGSNKPGTTGVGAGTAQGYPVGYVPLKSSSTSSVTVTAPMSVTISASGADAAAVGEIVKQQIDEHHDKTWRNIAAGTGAADEDQ